MNEKNDFALVIRPSSAVEKAAPGAKRILSGMVTDTLDLATSKEVAVSDEQVELWFQTGVRYFDMALGSPQDFVEAAKWYRKAAGQNHGGAQNELGILYYYGYGVPKDSREAAQWFCKAAEQAEHGNATAQYCLGHRYFHGLGVTKDKVEAAKWYRKAAEQGHAEAQCALGVCYAGGVMGTIMGKNLVEAVKWLNLALAQGFEQAKTILSILEQQMTPEQIAEARRLSGEFEPHTESRQAISNQFGIEGVSS